MSFHNRNLLLTLVRTLRATEWLRRCPSRHPVRPPTTTPSGEPTNPPSISSTYSPVFARDPDLQRSLDADCVIVTSPIRRAARTISCPCLRYGSNQSRALPAKATSVWARRSWPCASTLALGKPIAVAKELASNTVRDNGACVWGFPPPGLGVSLGTVIGLD